MIDLVHIDEIVAAQTRLQSVVRPTRATMAESLSRVVGRPVVDQLAGRRAQTEKACNVKLVERRAGSAKLTLPLAPHGDRSLLGSRTLSGGGLLEPMEHAPRQQIIARAVASRDVLRIKIVPFPTTAIAPWIVEKLGPARTPERNHSTNWPEVHLEDRWAIPADRKSGLAVKMCRRCPSAPCQFGCRVLCKRLVYRAARNETQRA